MKKVKSAIDKIAEEIANKVPLSEIKMNIRMIKSYGYDVDMLPVYEKALAIKQSVAPAAV